MGGVKFYVHKAVLTHNSAYFDKALNGKFLESDTQSIDLDDIPPEAFGGYVNVLYQVVLTQKVTLYDADDPDRRPYNSTNFTQLLRMWQLADRFLDVKMKAIAEDGIRVRLSHFSVSSWEEYYELHATKSDFFAHRFQNFQKGFQICKEGNIPFQDQLVTALANCPPQLFAEQVEHLNEDFKTAVTKAFALRYVGCQGSEKVFKKQTPKKTGTPKKRKLNEC